MGILEKLRIKSTFYGKDDDTPYLTRYRLTPAMRWGQLCLHIFHRGDADRDPHDHPRDFWTFPLTAYTEWVMDEDGELVWNYVGHFRWHYRPAHHSHIVIGPFDKDKQGKSFATFMWRKPVYRDWGFWVEQDNEDVLRILPHKGNRTWVPWDIYLGVKQ